MKLLQEQELENFFVGCISVLYIRDIVALEEKLKKKL